MSTRSNIILVLNEKDYGKVLSFDKDKVGKECDMEGTVVSPEVAIPTDKKYMYIYHHWDGYPEGVGETLLNEFNDYDRILNLLLGGDASTINGYSVCQYYFSRGDDWGNVSPKFTNDCPNGDLMIEWVYKFEDGVWYVKEGDWREVHEWEVLEDYLKNNSEDIAK